MNDRVPCRLWFYLASESDRVAVLRRGPSEQSRLMLWHTDTDRLELGQRLEHRVEPHSCDLSPSGEYFLYLVKSYAGDPALWVALSRPPTFSALAMWPIADAWGGDCCFVEEGQLWIQPGMHQERVVLADGYQLEHHQLVQGSFGSHWRWRRDGWRPTVPEDYPPGWGKFFLPWEKPDRTGSFVLRRTYCEERSKLPGYGAANSFQFAVEGGDTSIPLEDVNWADWDRSGRILMATRSGTLCTGQVKSDGAFESNEVADLSG